MTSLSLSNSSTVRFGSGKVPLPHNNYFYALHRNADGQETVARLFGDKETALMALANEVRESLEFVQDGVRSSSHTLKRFANVEGQPSELLEEFLVTTEDWAGFGRPRKSVETVRVRRSRN